MSRSKLVDRAVGLGLLAVLVFGPTFLDHNWVDSILTQTFLVGIAAASLVFLSAYGGMVSLAQTALVGIAGFTLANVVTTNAQQGLNLGWNPWVGVLLAIAVATAIGLLSGRSPAVASASTS